MGNVEVITDALDMVNTRMAVEETLAVRVASIAVVLYNLINLLKLLIHFSFHYLLITCIYFIQF